MYDYKTGDYNVLVDKRDSDTSKFKLTVQRSESEPVKVTRIPKISFIQIKTENDS